jgi:signal transduction histidine kinase
MAIDFLGLSDSDNANKWHYKEKRADEISNEDKEIINECKCITREKQITLKNNDKRWFKVTKCPIINHEKKVIGICSVARDIDAEKTAAEQRETYVATLTHDLKTPTIAQIKALVREGEKPANQTKAIRIIILSKKESFFMPAFFPKNKAIEENIERCIPDKASM